MCKNINVLNKEILRKNYQELDIKYSVDNDICTYVNTFISIIDVTFHWEKNTFGNLLFCIVKKTTCQH